VHSRLIRRRLGVEIQCRYEKRSIKKEESKCKDDNFSLIDQSHFGKVPPLSTCEMKGRGFGDRRNLL
jgi:hypothetical protein